MVESNRYLVGAWLFAITASATVIQPLTLSWQTGYRNNHLHWHLRKDREVVASERSGNIGLWENTLALRVIHRDIYLLAKGSYAFGKENLSNGSFLGTFGYAVNLTPDRTYQLLLTPFIGYGADYQWHSLPKMSWFGPFIGGFLFFNPHNPLRFEAGYAYHREHLRFCMPDIKIKDGGNLEHSGWLGVNVWPNQQWTVGLYGQIQYFCSRSLNAAHEAGVFKIRWTVLSAAVTVGWSF